MAEDNKNEQSETEETPAAEAPEETPAAETPEETPAAETPAADTPEADAPDVVVEGDAIVTDEDLEEDVDDDDTPATPRVKPAIPGADLEVDIVREGEEALRGGSAYDEDGEEDGGADSDAEDFSQPIADAAIDL